MTGARRGASTGEGTRGPMVVTLDATGEVRDIVGAFAWLPAPEDAQAAWIERLQWIGEGQGLDAGTLTGLELVDGRYVDVHLIAEDDQRHFVMLDASASMLGAQRQRQTGVELALVEAQARLALRARHAPPRLQAVPLQALRRGAERRAQLIDAVRAPSIAIAAAVERLRMGRADDAEVAAIFDGLQRDAAQLRMAVADALLEPTASLASRASNPMPTLGELARMLEDTFAWQHAIALEVRVPQAHASRRIDHAELGQALVDLLRHAMQDSAGERLVLAFSPGLHGLDIELACEPSGFPAERFALLVNTPDLLASEPDASVALAIAQRLLTGLGASVELVPRQDHAHELWIRVPDRREADDPSPSRVREAALPWPVAAPMAVVAVEPPTAAARWVEWLVDRQVPVVAAHAIDQLEAFARSGTLGMLVVSIDFEGIDESTLLRIAANAGRPVLLVTPSCDAVSPALATACLQVPAHAGAPDLEAALDIVIDAAALEPPARRDDSHDA